jgi:hypothetical protein
MVLTRTAWAIVMTVQHREGDVPVVAETHSAC